MTETPRWRLMSAHYLNVLCFADGTKPEWQYEETSRESGRRARKLFKVPALLNPDDSADCNYPGELIVAYEGDGLGRNDIIFEGEPTNEMEPLNDAAREITERLRDKWEHPVESLAPTGQMSPAESVFMSKMMEAFERMAPPTTSNEVVPKSEFDALKSKLAELEALITKPAPERRV